MSNEPARREEGVGVYQLGVGLLGMMAWTLGLLGGMAALVAGAAAPSLGAWWANASGGRAPRELKAGAYQRACTRLLGKSKERVAETLGPPPAASMGHTGAVAMPGTFWNADTWYYPLSRQERLAIAILFAQNRAARVEFIGPVG